MLRAEQGVKTEATRSGSRFRRAPASVTALLLILIVASIGVFAAACGDDPTPTPEPTATAAPTATPMPTATPTATPEPEPVNEDDALTRAYVEKAIAYYDANGRDATLEYYKNEESIEGDRYLYIISKDEGILLAMPFYHHFLGSKHESAEFLLGIATEDGVWYEGQGIYVVERATGRSTRQGPVRNYLVLRNGLIFISGHSTFQENVAEATKDYVSRAIALYESEGLDATVAYYNNPDSLEGNLYLFLIGADDNYLAHPTFPHLIGTDIKGVIGSDGQELGKEIALATEEGIWVKYLWPTPITRVEELKTTWAIRHDGLIFASGYYTEGEPPHPRAWQGADPKEYTIQYVNKAIERYERDGLESMLNYYNSVASFEGEWYLFATDENDIYHVHPLLPYLVGTDIKDVVGSDGYELGKELAKAGEGKGVWVEYLWPHPVTLKEVPKVGYAVRRDGMIFASGYYPSVTDPAAYTQAYVQKAMDYYDSQGLEATVAHYNSSESIDGSYWLMMVDPQGVIVVSGAEQALVGVDASLFRGIVAGEEIGESLLSATKEGHWFKYLWPNPRTAGQLTVYLWIIRHDGYVFSSAYYVEGDGDAPPPTDSDDALTRSYVSRAIDYYEENGRDATVEFYKSEAGTENGRTLILMDEAEGELLVYRNIPALEGQYVGPGSRYSNLTRLMEIATEEGYWTTAQGINPVTKQEEPRRVLLVLHDGLVFSASHSALVEDVADSVKEYVDKAIAKYEADGLDSVIAHYNGQDSLDGQFYLFLIGTDDNYLAHPIFPHLIGTDIKDVVGSDGQELGREIAQATEDGTWVEYLWPHPTTRREQQKVTWAIQHDGLIFASGYYTGGTETGAPAWRDADPREYTIQYVNRAIERYERDGLESMLNYYNSVASFEGEWYLFATDDQDIYHVHPLIPRLIGTDIKDVVGSDGYELGKELAKAVDGGEGVWVEYLWPHPVTLKEVPKVGYAVRKDGMLFASGYYVSIEDPAGRTTAYVQEAIEYYKSNGLEATIDRYNSEESLDGQWGLTLADENDILRVAHLTKHLIGTDLKDLGTARQIGKEMAAATEEGLWVSYVFPNTRSSETLYAHTWAIRYDGLLFFSRYYDDKPEVTLVNDDALTRAYVSRAIDYYEENGRDATVEFYKSEAGTENGRTLILLDEAEGELLVYRNIPALEGQYVGPGSRYPSLTRLMEIATEEGYWTTTQGINPVTKQEEPRRVLLVLHDGLVFSASHSALVEDVADSVKEYVDKAIAKYEADGLDSVIAHYNGQDSLDGQFYLFLIGTDDIYLAHPIFPHLIGTDIKDVVGSDGQELGKEIAQATQEGVWVEYLWPHPISRKEQQKVTWALRHDGLIFASGYYAGEPESGPPAWRDADPREYTIQYVNRAIERYERDGLESMLNYYNSVASFEGEWYLFATDDQDIYHVHPLLPRLIGTDIKDVIGSDGYELGKELAKATEGGVWVEYLWPHPVTLKEVPKVGYAVRKDGMLFASGYYVSIEDPAGRTTAYVQEAIEYYKSNGLEATIDRYNSEESLDGQWGLTLADENDILRVAHLTKHLIGTDLKDLGTARQIGKEMAAATEEGLWISYVFPNTRSSETLYAHTWAIRYDGLLFMSRYYDDQPDNPDTP